MKTLDVCRHATGMPAAEFSKYVHRALPEFSKIRRIVVAGTNGKGMTAAFAAAALTSVGLKTGLFLSPHIQHYEERFAIDGRCIDEATLKSLLQRHASIASALNTFQLLTLCAVSWFVDRKVDAVVLEVGVGGRLDPTNLVGAPVAIITSIGLDHTELLGQTTAEILAQKLPIAPAGSTLIFAEPEPTLCRQAELYCQEHQIKWIHQKQTKAQLEGQKQSALLAVSALLGQEVALTCEVTLPGRYYRHNHFVLDLAHNRAAILRLLTDLKQSQLILAKPQQKNWGNLVTLFAECRAKLLCPEIDYLEAGQRYFTPAAQLQQQLQAAGRQATRCADLAEALRMAGTTATMITGSSRLVGLAYDLIGLDSRSTPIYLTGSVNLDR